MKKGIFWCKGADGEEPRLITVSVSCNTDGAADPSTVFSSKSGNNFNHETEWKSLHKSITEGFSYNYFPRGRVEIKNGRATVFLNPDINTEKIRELITVAFELDADEKLLSVAFKSDGSDHYLYTRDDDETKKCRVKRH